MARDFLVRSVSATTFEREARPGEARFYERGGGYFVVADWSDGEYEDRYYPLSTKRKARKLADLLDGGARARRRNRAADALYMQRYYYRTYGVMDWDALERVEINLEIASRDVDRARRILKRR